MLSYCDCHWCRLQTLTLQEAACIHLYRTSVRSLRKSLLRLQKMHLPEGCQGWCRDPLTSTPTFARVCGLLSTRNEIYAFGSLFREGLCRHSSGRWNTGKGEAMKWADTDTGRHCLRSHSSERCTAGGELKRYHVDRLRRVAIFTVGPLRVPRMVGVAAGPGQVHCIRSLHLGLAVGVAELPTRTCPRSRSLSLRHFHFV